MEGKGPKSFLQVLRRASNVGKAGDVSRRFRDERFACRSLVVRKERERVRKEDAKESPRQTLRSKASEGSVKNDAEVEDRRSDNFVRGDATTRKDENKNERRSDWSSRSLGELFTCDCHD